ncbi:MAG: hypothetical protein KatS3mg004_1493 [Bryobacteraceae bacterium]|nr:MAG: hypothetical protein KatS3mg004_1493 [Bryobacteraceae bacterium]
MVEPATPWGAVVAVLVLVGGGAWLWLRQRGLPGFGPLAPRGPAELVQRLALTPHHSLHIVRVGDQMVWIVTFPNGAVLHRVQPFSELVATMEAGTGGRQR